tara:strand:- start:4209 stop:4403 length:195 start_codon:yes stop_codon:yes gene_type:complete
MSLLKKRLEELDLQNVKGKKCYEMAQIRIKGGYNGNISILIEECKNEIKNQAHTNNFESEYYAY